MGSAKLELMGHCPLERQFASRIETGEWSFSVPLIGRQTI
jgi:hypothetical protein